MSACSAVSCDILVVGTPHATFDVHEGLMLFVLCQGSGTISVSLPAHKVTPHDVVELRPSKGDASAPAIASGVVHRSVTLCVLSAEVLSVVLCAIAVSQLPSYHTSLYLM